MANQITQELTQEITNPRTSEFSERLEREMTLLKKGVVELIGEEELEQKLLRFYETNKPLVIKLGLDPSAPDIHLGHTVVLQKIRQFQSLGHKAMIIIGDFTGRIGDPTGKNKSRKQLTEREVLENADTYKEQLLKVLDPEKTILCFNSEWLERITLKDMIHLMSQQSLMRLLERDSFKKRMKDQEPIFLHELLYPLLQGMDSLEIEADVELGGMDQKFNILMGRDMQHKEGREKQVAIFMPILEGLDGVEKMSKSLGNYVGVTESANVMIEKLMTIPDKLMERYMTLLTDLHPQKIEELIEEVNQGHRHPKALKLEVAARITSTFHSEEDVEKAKENFINVHEKGKMPEDMQSFVYVSGLTLEKVLVDSKLTASLSESRRLVKQKGVKVNKMTQDDPECVKLEAGDIIQIGKKRFLQLL